MPEKRMVWLILGLILIAVVAAYFIFKVLGLQPGMDFPKGKETLVRYYACSLAICTHGCDWLNQDDPNGHGMCLDNDTLTRECNLWCYDVCVDEFGDVCDEAGDCCGPQYNLSVSLVGRAPFKCYKDYFFGPLKVVEGGGSDIYHHWYPEKPFYNKLVENEGFPKIIGPFDESILSDSCYEKNLNPSWSCSYSYEIERYFFPGLLRTENDTSFSHCSKTGKIGVGIIYMDSIESYEKYGCSGDCTMSRAGGRFGFDQCLFQDKISIWSDWQDDGCADVRFNSTIGGDWKFTIECTDPKPVDVCYQRINLNETSDPYTIVIDNQLGSGKKFILQWSDNRGKKANCTLWKNSPDEEIYEIYVGNGETKEFYMSCTPTDTGSYSIYIDARPNVGPTGKRTMVELVTSDFEWWVRPEDEQKINKDESQRYTVEIHSEMGMDTYFDLGLSTNPAGLTCKFDVNDDVTYTLSILDDDYNTTTFTCSDDPGWYKININVDAGGMKQDSKTRYLNITECSGDVNLEISHSSTCDDVFGDCVWVDEDFTLKVFGLDGCEDWMVNFYRVDDSVKTVVGQCAPDDWDDLEGTECTRTTSRGEAGTFKYRVEIDIDENGTIDAGEWDQGWITVKEYPPCRDYDAKSDENRNDCEAETGCYWCTCFTDLRPVHWCRFWYEECIRGSCSIADCGAGCEWGTCPGESECIAYADDCSCRRHP